LNTWWSTTPHRIIQDQATVGNHARQQNRRLLFMNRVPRNKAVQSWVWRPTVRCESVGSVVAFLQWIRDQRPCRRSVEDLKNKTRWAQKAIFLTNEQICCSERKWLDGKIYRCSVGSVQSRMIGECPSKESHKLALST
jgi:hypothetical protein